MVVVPNDWWARIPPFSVLASKKREIEKVLQGNTIISKGVLLWLSYGVGVMAHLPAAQPPRLRG